MNWYIFEIAINFYQGFIFIFFMRKLLLYSKRNLWIDTAFVLTIGTLLSLHQFLNLTIPDTLIFILPFVHAFIFSEGKWYVCLFWTLILGIITIGMAELFGCVLSGTWAIDWESLLSETSARLIYVIGTNIAITITIIIIASIKRTHNSAPKRVIAIFLAVLLVELFTNEAVYLLQTKHPEGHDIYIWISAFTLIAVGMIILLYETMSVMSAHQRQIELSNQTTDLNHAYQEELKLIYQNMLAEQHDLRQRLDIAEKMLETYTPAEYEHIEAVLPKQKLSSPQVTGNIAVDAILAAKETAMRHAGIEFSYSGTPLNILPISESDFCVLLSNLLDNAIEGVLRLPAASSSRRVKLVISHTWNMFSIICQNDMNPLSIKKQGNIWISSKPNSAVHGFGTQSIQNIVESADGFVEFTPEADQFLVRIVIPERE